MESHLVELARRNLFDLTSNPYRGRIIVLGMDSTGKYMIQLYAIMGRSENSRNRVLREADGRVFTEAADPSKMTDPSLIIYNAMGEYRSAFVVSNGQQTDEVLNAFVTDGDLREGLMDYKYEPDRPNFTPRITGVSYRVGRPFFELSILRKSQWDDSCERHTYSYETIGDGFGYCVSTYSGDGNPLPSFTGEPFLVPLSGDIDSVAQTYWRLLNQENRVALVVKFIPLNGAKSFTRILPQA